MSNETPYQIAPQVEALQAERANCVAYGNETRVTQIDRQLADIGARKDAAEKRAATSDGEETKKSAPKGRRAKSEDQTAAAEGVTDGPRV